jgi:hypothetical protein
MPPAGMDILTSSLIAAGASVAAIHTLLGPDHYLPFVMLARAHGWSRRRTALVTALALVAAGIGFGVAIGSLERFEALRGGLAAWALVAFGLAYGAWGVRRALRGARGIVAHAHEQHVHVHAGGDRPHSHGRAESSAVTSWTLFTIVVLGPCEPLIPLVVLPASQGRIGAAVATALVFGLVTVATMTVVATLGAAGMARVPLAPLERWAHALAGAVVAASGGAVLLLGV